ncbi:ABC transporter substrate-binding protein [Pseudomonas corrugata]
MRHGVKFHDGSAFNAAAVKKSIDYVKQLKQGAAFVWKGLDTVEALADDTVVLKFKSPTPANLIAAGQYAAYIIAPAAVEKGHDWMMAPTPSVPVPISLGRSNRASKWCLSDSMATGEVGKKGNLIGSS